MRDRSLRILFARGADWIIIDQGHGAVGSESLHATIAATAGTRCAPFPLVSVSKRDEVPVKLALDLGAEGIMFPQVGNAEGSVGAPIRTACSSWSGATGVSGGSMHGRTSLELAFVRSFPGRARGGS